MSERDSTFQKFPELVQSMAKEHMENGLLEAIAIVVRMSEEAKPIDCAKAISVALLANRNPVIAARQSGEGE